MLQIRNMILLSALVVNSFDIDAAWADLDAFFSNIYSFNFAPFLFNCCFLWLFASIFDGKKILGAEFIQMKITKRCNNLAVSKIAWSKSCNSKWIIECKMLRIIRTIWKKKSYWHRLMFSLYEPSRAQWIKNQNKYVKM